MGNPWIIRTHIHIHGLLIRGRNPCLTDTRVRIPTGMGKDTNFCIHGLPAPLPNQMRQNFWWGTVHRPWIRPLTVHQHLYSPNTIVMLLTGTSLPIYICCRVLSCAVPCQFLPKLASCTGVNSMVWVSIKLMIFRAGAEFHQCQLTLAATLCGASTQQTTV